MEHTKLLRIILDEKVTCNDHVEALVDKVSSGLWVWRNLAKFGSLEILEMVSIMLT